MEKLPNVVFQPRFNNSTVYIKAVYHFKNQFVTKHANYAVNLSSYERSESLITAPI